ncbi:MAG: hypothetical protein KC468_30070 [Myxococcales bacterium]|nr:hypothetical protein [Myxococcales bacterium]
MMLLIGRARGQKAAIALLGQIVDSRARGASSDDHPAQRARRATSAGIAADDPFPSLNTLMG